MYLLFEILCIELHLRLQSLAISNDFTHFNPLFNGFFALFCARFANEAEILLRFLLHKLLPSPLAADLVLNI